MEHETLEISASTFKAKCLELLDRLAGRKIMRIVVTKRGRPVAQLPQFDMVERVFSMV